MIPYVEALARHLEEDDGCPTCWEMIADDVQVAVLADELGTGAVCFSLECIDRAPHCHGVLIVHRDGEIECTLGDACRVAEGVTVHERSDRGFWRVVEREELHQGCGDCSVFIDCPVCGAPAAM